MAITIKRPKLTLKPTGDEADATGARAAGVDISPTGPGIELTGEPPQGKSYLFDVICGALAVVCMLALLLVQLAEKSYY